VSTGGSSLSAVRFGILPQLLPVLLSQVLYAFESNTRSASIIGIVGAGGIGEELYKVISFNYYEEISAIIVLVILAVVCIDLASEALRRRVIEAVS
jgi:phosphonate transport system permease protein